MSKYPTSYAFQSRYGQHRSVTRVDATHYLVEGVTHYMRGGHDPQTDWVMVDFEGGPFIATDEPLQECVGAFPCLHESAVVKTVKQISPQAAAAALGYTDSAVVASFDKPHYSYCLVEIYP